MKNYLLNKLIKFSIAELIRGIILLKRDENSSNIKKIKVKIYLISSIIGLITLFLPIFTLSFDLYLGVLNGKGFIVESWFTVIGLEMFQNARLYIHPSGFYLGIFLLIGIYICLFLVIFDKYAIKMKDGKINNVLGIIGGGFIMLPPVILFILGFFDINLILNNFFAFPLDVLNLNLYGIGFIGAGTGEIIIGSLLFDFSLTWNIFFGQLIGIMAGFFPIICEILDILERKNKRKIFLN